MASRHCPNCAAPIDVDLGQVEVPCKYCGSLLRFLPGQEELEVVRTREEMKRRERVEVQKAILNKQLQQEESERWRQAAGRVAIAAMPVVGEAAGRAAFRAAFDRTRGCFGCGCAAAVLLLLALVGGLSALLGG
jgi:uncharacterized Zn finger protein (UPF0148 family)